MSVLEISELGCHMATQRGFITLSVKGETIQRLPISHIDAIISKAHGITYSQNLLVKLAEHNIPVVITNQRFMPVSMVLPIAAYHSNHHLNAQISSTLNQNNRLWQSIIKSKIKMQMAVLDVLEIENPLQSLVSQVNQGDSRNIEAQAAKHYWRRLFGDSFRRHPEGLTPNEMLNYGYAICRSAIAREVCATGLNPAIGIHHKNHNNAFCLVDDLIEPYRPLVDYIVWHCLRAGEHTLNSTVKAALVGLLEQTVRSQKQWVTVESSIRDLAQSLAKAYCEQHTSLHLPRPNLKKLYFNI